MTFDRLEEPIGPRLPALGREGQQRQGGRGMEGEAREAEKKVIPCIGAAGGIAQMMLRWEGHVWRKKKTSRAYVSIFTTPPGRQSFKRGI